MSEKQSIPTHIQANCIITTNLLRSKIKVEIKAINKKSKRNVKRNLEKKNV